MNINISHVSNYMLSFFRENVPSSLSAQYKKILMVVSIALGFIAICYMAKKKWFNGKVEEGIIKKEISSFLFKDDEQRVVEDIEILGDENVYDYLPSLTSKSTPKPDLLTDEYGIINGKGKRIYASNNVAEGEFKNGKLNGKGKRTYPSGKIDEGEFEDGRLNGKGKIIGISWSSGGVWEGEFKNGWLNGRGKRPYPDGAIGEGEFKNCKLHGKGKKTWPDGRIEEGIYQNGVLI